MRILLLILAFLPFLYFATRDQIFHLRGRKVSLAENLLHLGIGLTLAMLFTQALKASYGGILVALGLFALTGGIDEFVYHRNIPGEESDLHAKEHLALTVWLAIALITDWLEGHQWSLSEALAQLG